MGSDRVARKQANVVSCSVCTVPSIVGVGRPAPSLRAGAVFGRHGSGTEAGIHHSCVSVLLSISKILFVVP
jgi:hypothetical protein